MGNLILFFYHVKIASLNRYILVNHGVKSGDAS